jgi:hypothetical protein
MASTGVRRRDTTKGPPLRILSLDGGGVRGYSMLIILQELMYRTYVEMEGRPPRRDQIPKPCDVFDLIIGTGTGGLIALMLGRLRMDLETCKELYVRLTRVVFETDKTFAGIPYRSTLFKASKLEEVIKECVQEHTVFIGEGNDGAEVDLVAPLVPSQSTRTPRRNPSNASVLSFSAKSPHAQMARPTWNNKLGNPEARLYDAREHRTKTAITAIYKGTPKDGRPVLLRSYDSRREPPIEFDCKVWEAGRATCAVGLAFKPIQIGQSIFHDDGAGTFNPSPEALDEAVVNEWPGREVGVFLSVGTGKRPKAQDNNHQLWYEGFLGGFAEARQRLISKIENCETIHEYMVHEHLSRRNVNIENYYRLNVEMGVGEFGMNEWHRLSDISTSTRRYLMREREQKMVEGISTKLAKIQRARQRFERLLSNQQLYPDMLLPKDLDMVSPLAVELPADIPQDWPPPSSPPPSRQSYDSGPDSLLMTHRRTPSPISPNSARVSSSSHMTNPSTPTNYHHHLQHRLSASVGNGSGPNSLATMMAREQPPPEPDSFMVSAPTPSQYHMASGSDKIAITEGHEMPRQYRFPQPYRIDPPPIPPKTPLPEHQTGQFGRLMGGVPVVPPYPVEEDEPPPFVNMAKKPEYRRR